MRVVLYGAGAIGGVIAARLANAGTEVVAIARGAQLEAMRREGLTVLGPGEDRLKVTLEASDAPDAVRPADVVVVALKDYGVAQAAAAIARLRKPDGLVVFLQNGLPWWLLPAHLATESLLPALFPAAHTAAGAVYIAAHVRSPGSIEHIAGLQLTLGLLARGSDPRLERLATSLSAAGLQAKLVEDVRVPIWEKLVLNVAHNAVAMLSGATSQQIWRSSDLAALAEAMGEEASTVGRVLGVDARMDVPARKRNAAAHKPSTLQDFEAGRPIEYEALYGRLLAVARQVGVATPTIAAVAALMRHAALQRGCPIA